MQAGQHSRHEQSEKTDRRQTKIPSSIQQINVIKEALNQNQKNKDTNIEAKDIYELRDELVKLPIFGSNIKDMLGKYL